jgi:hypothetical protein
MPVTRVLMDNGSWSLDLRPETPETVTQALDITTKAFSHIVITPTWIDHEVTDHLTLLAMSIYTGVLFQRRDRLQIGGQHATAWLKDASGIARYLESTGSVTRTFKEWVEFVQAVAVHVGVGAIDDITPMTDLTWTPPKASPRDILEAIVNYFRTVTGNPSIEWRVTDALAIEAGTTFNLYNSDTPVAVLTTDVQGTDPGVQGIEATFDVEDDVDDYITYLLFGYAAGGGVGIGGAATPYVDVFGDPVERMRDESDTNLDLAQALAVGASIVDEFDQSRRHVSATTKRYGVLVDIPVGSYAWVYDQDKGLVDTDNQLYWRGAPISPVGLRVLRCTMPVEAGMGVYVMQGDEVTDLTRWVVPERPGASLDLGAYPRRYALR